MTTAASHSTTTTGDIIARPSNDYRIRRYLMVLMFIAMGFWFAYDGFVRYPRENKEFETVQEKMQVIDQQDPKFLELSKEQKSLKHHTDTDLLLQRALGFFLPPAGFAVLAWALFNSRGVYRLSGNTLHIPGHRPIPLSTIREVDTKLWDRKGIAMVSYLLPNSVQKLSFKLDDYIYDRSPTDAIYKRIEEHLKTPEG